MASTSTHGSRLSTDQSSIVQPNVISVSYGPTIDAQLVSPDDDGRRTFIYTALGDFAHGERLLPLYVPDLRKPCIHWSWEELNLGPRTILTPSYPLGAFSYTDQEDSTQDGRLMVLHPGVADKNIICDIMDVKIAAMSSFRYKALSYVWGQENPTYEVQLNGKLKFVRENLWMALQQLRLVDKYRVLWVDAICINQENEDERKEQVQRMGDIYSKASTVLIWLGPEGWLSDLAFLFINSLEADAKERKDWTGYETKVNKVAPEFYEE
jgi:hypothetical protein